MGTLSGANLVGQEANPQAELDFQVARKMDKIFHIRRTLLHKGII